MATKILPFNMRLLFVSIAILAFLCVSAMAQLTPILNTHIQPISGIVSDFSQEQTAVIFQELLQASHGDVARARESTKDWMQLDAETRLYWALAGIREKDPVAFDETLRNYRLQWAPVKPGANIIFPPVSNGFIN
jgi:hypothetical protein